MERIIMGGGRADQTTISNSTARGQADSPGRRDVMVGETYSRTRPNMLAAKLLGRNLDPVVID
jgi:hypothetical protein